MPGCFAPEVAGLRDAVFLCYLPEETDCLSTFGWSCRYRNSLPLQRRIPVALVWACHATHDMAREPSASLPCSMDGRRIR